MAEVKAHLLRPNATVALVYLRLSGVEESELSPDIQLKLNLRNIAAFGFRTDARLEANNILGGDVYADTTKGLHSAFKRDRMQMWISLLERARTDTDVAAVVVYDLSRTFRSIQAMLEETKLLNSFGVHLIVSGEIVNLTDPQDWARWIDQAKQAEFESRITTWRLQGHYKEMRDLGIYHSHKAPFGLTRSGKRHKVEWSVNAQFPIVVRGLTLYAEGLSCANVALTLRAEGHTWTDPSRQGHTSPSEMTIQKWLNALDRYKPHLDAALVYRVESEKARRSNHQANSKKVKHPLPYLRQLVFCDKCGRRYYTHGRTLPGGRDSAVYTHPTDSACPVKGQTLGATGIHEQFIVEFARLRDFTDADFEKMAERLTVPAASPTRQDTRTERDKLNLELTNLRRSYNRGDFGDPADDEARAFFRAEQTRLQDALKTLAAVVPVEDTTLDAGLVVGVLDDLRAAFVERTELDPVKTNALMRTILKGVYLRDREIVRVEYKPEWKGLEV